MASIEITGITTTSISCRLTALDTSYEKSDRVAHWYVNGVLTDAIYLSAGVYSGADVTFNNLASGTMHSIYAVVYYDYNGSSYDGSVTIPTVTVQTTAARPPYFYWTYPKQKGGTFNLTAIEWNALTSNINAVRAYYGQSYFWFTSAYKGNQVLADMFNECLYALNPMYLYTDLMGIAVSSGDAITADMLNYLVTLVNGL